MFRIVTSLLVVAFVAAFPTHSCQRIMSRALIVEFRVRPERVDDFAATIAHNARTSAAEEPGCRQFDVCRDPDDPGLFFLYEIYDDDAAIAAHLAAPHFLAFDAQVRDWVLDKTVRRMTRTVP